MLTPSGRPFSQLTQVNDLRDDDFLPLLRPSEPLPDDQNVILSGARAKELLGGDSSGGGATLPLYGGPGTHTDGPMHQLAATLLANRGSNLRPGGPFYATVLTTASTGYVAGTARDEIAAALLCIGARCYTEFNDGPNRATGQIDQVVYDPAGPLLVHRNGFFADPAGLPARWERADAKAAGVPAYGQLDAGYAFAVDELVRDYAGGGTELFFAALADGPLPAPTDPDGDANWRRVAEADVPAPASLLHTVPSLIAAQDLPGAAQLQPQHAYRITAGDTATGYDVQVVALNSTAFRPEAVLIVPATSGTPEAYLPGTYDPTTGVFTAAAADVWRYIGDPAKHNISQGDYDASNTHGTDHELNTYGAYHLRNTYGDEHDSNTYGSAHNDNVYSTDHYANTYGIGHDHNTYGSGFKGNTLGHYLAHNTFGDDIHFSHFADNCSYLQVGSNQTRLTVINCSGTSGSPFVIPAGTTDAVYRNNALVPQLPPITPADYGKVLGVNATTGALEWVSAGTSPTSSSTLPAPLPMTLA